MTSTAEVIRQQHEDIEILKQLAVKALQSRSDPTAPHPRLKALSKPLASTMEAEQLAAFLISSARSRAEGLISLYQSNDDPFNLQSSDKQTSDASSLFYAALRELRDVHRTRDNQFANPRPSSLIDRDASLLASFKPALFSGEEANGRFLDLQTHFRQYLNISKNRSLLYHQYVRDKLNDEFDDDVPLGARWTRPYGEYVSSLFEYLCDFASRAHPLDGIDRHIKTALEKARDEISSELSILREQNPSPDALLKSIDQDRIKKTLAKLGLKSGGRPIEKAKRLWEAADHGHFKESAVHCKVISFLANDLLAEEKAATVANIENKLSLSYQEIEAERRAAEISSLGGRPPEDENTAEVESTIYNPKDVPLGWDGKPIPYWMYKLHGLNHEFKCEICGGATYKGPRAFERHFTDQTHVSGLRRLGIGYSKSFMMVTRIQDALQLQERLHGRQSQLEFDRDREVEVEDNNGNVMNLKTMNDLKRQGLL